MSRTLRVGVIGASARRGWAKISHIPAIRQLEGLELAAVVGQDQASAEEAARAFGAARAYGDPGQLFADRDIDIVTVAVNVPAHRALVLGALAAGKPVFCEYPLGRDVTESEMLAQAARAAGVHTAIGLQLRASPAARRARELVTGGAIGRVLHASILSTTLAFGPDTEAALAFAEDAANGVTLATIQAAHTLDLAVAVLGGIAELSALAATQFPQVRVEGMAPRARTIPDYLTVLARLESGAPLSIETIGGRPAGDMPFRFTIAGEQGVLRLEGGAARGVQSGILTLSRDGEPVAVEAFAVSAPETAAHVAGLYGMFRDDLLNGTRTVPGFDHAVQVARLIADALLASERGGRVGASGWPAG